MRADRFRLVWQRLRAPHAGRRSPLAARFALAAAIVVLLPGLLSGCGLSTSLLTAHEQGTIVVEVMQTSFPTGPTANGGDERRKAWTTTSTTITETSANGNGQSSFSEDPLPRPGYQQVEAGDSLQLYDPADHTIYMTTERAWQAAVTRQMDRNAPKGSRSASSTVTFDSPSPGRTSVFEQQLHARLYKPAGHLQVDGRIALKLVPTQPRVRLNPHSHTHQLLGTAYVTPHAYDPIEEVTPIPGFGGGRTSVLVNRWLTYKVLPATAANRKLVSLTARHPDARIVHGAAAYIRAQAIENRRSTLIRPTAH